MNNEMLHLGDIRAEEAAALLRGKVINSIISLLKADICDESNERLQSLVKSKKDTMIVNVADYILGVKDKYDKNCINVINKVTFRIVS